MKQSCVCPLTVVSDELGHLGLRALYEVEEDRGGSVVVLVGDDICECVNLFTQPTSFLNLGFLCGAQCICLSQVDEHCFQERDCNKALKLLLVLFNPGNI